MRNVGWRRSVDFRSRSRLHSLSRFGAGSRQISGMVHARNSLAMDVLARPESRPAPGWWISGDLRRYRGSSAAAGPGWDRLRAGSRASRDHLSGQHGVGLSGPPNRAESIAFLLSL